GTTTEPARVLLEERRGEERRVGAWETVSTRVGEADAELNRLVGMSADQFFQVVLLPQGEFARFLRADATERGKLLARLVGTDRFRGGGEWVGARRGAAAEAVAGGRQHAGLLAARIAQAAGSGEVPDPADLPWATALADQRRAEAETAQRAALRRQAELDQAAA